MSEVLAVIRNVGIGIRDMDEPVLWFDTYTSESRGALQVLSWEDAKTVMRHVNRSAGELEGRACWVAVEGSMMRFLHLFGDGR